jgi:hypothetical protein
MGRSRSRTRAIRGRWTRDSPPPTVRNEPPRRGTSNFLGAVTTLVYKPGPVRPIDHALMRNARTFSAEGAFGANRSTPPYTTIHRRGASADPSNTIAHRPTPARRACGSVDGARTRVSPGHRRPSSCCRRDGVCFFLFSVFSAFECDPTRACLSPAHPACRSPSSVVRSPGART